MVPACSMLFASYWNGNQCDKKGAQGTPGEGEKEEVGVGSLTIIVCSITRQSDCGFQI